ncbi:hypothetical protein RB595_006842 [Gaeumannomyces hyphopodioides]
MAIHSWQDSAARVAGRAWEVLKVNWHLGFTSFGGPPVHFKIFHDMFVHKRKWIDEQVYQELFSISQALSGPGSTKMLYCINLIHDDTFGAVLAFLIWSLPGALGMFALSVGVSNIQETLPRAVYALLSGLNSATVGIIALAAVELAQKAVTDKLTRLIVSVTGVAGLLYNALWYFPALVLASSCATVAYDLGWLHPAGRAVGSWFTRRRPDESQERAGVEEAGQHRVEVPTGTSGLSVASQAPLSRRGLGTAAPASPSPPSTVSNQEHAPGLPPTTPATDEPRVIAQEYRLNMSWRTSAVMIGAFFTVFAAVMATRAAVPDRPLLFSLFANLLLAGTIIFGGGPVVIPLLREYVVAEGWVSPRDFLIGLAVAQAFPGPNFNFAVFLGGLAARHAGAHPAWGSAVAFAAIFSPGMVLVHGTMGVWPSLRSRPQVRSAVRGLNAGAVGLIFTAVYRIWQVGFLDEGFESGRSLGDDPWWVVVAATSYVGGRYFGLAAPLAILIGAVLGLVRHAVVSSS